MTIPQRFTVQLSLFIALTTTTWLYADLRLPGFFGDHMVLQQEKPIKVWGWGDAGDEISVSLSKATAKTKVADNGTWQVELPAMKAGSEAYSLKVSTGNNSIELSDVLIGEVWLCSGQSNMEWSVARSSNAQSEIEAAKYPHIRHIKVARRPSVVPIDDIQSKWEVCSPETAGNFTACGYFMARKLHKELNVPIGLLNSSWGGTRVEPWTPPVGFEKVPAVKNIFESVIGRTPGTDKYKQTLNQHIDDIVSWTAKAKEALASNEKLAPSPTYPDSLKPFQSHQDPTMLYNGMIHALVGFPFRGAIWYQGESNHAEGMLYYEKKKALINGWREIWDQGDFPFYYVQIAPFRYGNEDPKILARFWEAQAAVEELPNTAMVVINDIATLNDIHPPNKQDVGLRLANLALRNDYGRKSLKAHSPVMDSMKTTDSTIEVTFRNTAGGLSTRDGKRPSHFEIVGQGSGGFQPAVATVDGDRVILTNPNVEKPSAFRFAWNKLAEPNLIGGTGLPVGAVRGGRVPEFLDIVPDRDKYELVYELNLAKLRQDIVYDVDNSSRITKPFDRIAYLLELNSEDHGQQNVFVSVDAFTKNISKIGIPTFKSKANFRRKLSSMDVYSDVESIKAAQGISTGNIEFWPNNYGQANADKIEGASSEVYDFGDQPTSPKNGYGSMQIHNFGQKQTVFAINAWNKGNNADIGIGNCTGENTDWTFQRNGATYSTKRLKVFVRPKK